MSSEKTGITGIILAGGAGRRMGGADKGLLSLQGRPLVEYVIERLSPQVDELQIVANRNLPTYADYGYPVISDAIPDFAGPLVGMLSGLSACPTSHALFVPADAPLLPSDLASRLQHTGKLAAVAADAHGWQPLCCLLSIQLLPDLQRAVEGGERSPRRWLQEQNADVIRFPDDEWVWSINTPQELSQLQTQAELAA